MKRVTRTLTIGITELESAPFGPVITVIEKINGQRYLSKLALHPDSRLGVVNETVEHVVTEHLRRTEFANE